MAIGTGDGGDSNVVELPDQRNNTWKWVAGVAAALALIFGALLAVENLNASQLTGDSIITAAEQLADDPGSIVGDFLVDDVSVAQVVLSADGRGFVIPTADLQVPEPGPEEPPRLPPRRHRGDRASKPPRTPKAPNMATTLISTTSGGSETARP